jgi:hypothetical protein
MTKTCILSLTICPEIASKEFQQNLNPEFHNQPKNFRQRVTTKACILSLTICSDISHTHILSLTISSKTPGR